jgi:hypothetical protein
MPSLLGGKLGPWSSCQLTVLTYPLSLQQILASLISSCGYTHRFCRKDDEKTTSHRKELLTKLSNQRDHADMRLACGSPVMGCVLRHLKLFFAARGPPKTGFAPRRGRGTVSPKSRISLSAGRRACKPAAKPAIPGVILVHNGFVWPERTRGG